MKKFARIFIGLVVLSALPVFGQDRNLPESKAEAAPLTKFDLDFPGGAPNELIAAIDKAMGRPLNAIVDGAYATIKLPELKMKGVDASQLFRALEQATTSVQAIPTNYGVSTTYQNISYSFRTQGPITDDSIWSFWYNGPQKAARFYLLTPYLDRGLTVDDITTAIQAAWKLLGDSPTPTLSFHRETNLLIAYGDIGQLQTIDAALRALNPPSAAAKAAPKSPQ